MVANEGKAGKDIDLTFHIFIGKTQTPHQVCINMQLYKLLKEFKWKGFYQRSK